MSDSILLRQWRGLTFRNPSSDLIALGKLQSQLQKKGFSPTVDDLRTRDLRKYHEARQAALFSYLAGTALKVPVEYSLFEAADYDCVVRVQRRKYQPVQLKEIVPRRINVNADLNSGLSKLTKYATSERTVVAIYLNQSGELPDFSKIVLSEIRCAEVWLYGALCADQSKWFLFGNLLAKPLLYEARFPT